MKALFLSALLLPAIARFSYQRDSLNIPLFISKNLSDRETYCNSRFNYCLDYPSSLIPQAESTNGDGRVFHNNEGETVLTVFGRLNQNAEGNPLTLKKQFNADIKDLRASKASISYQKLGIDFYVLSGIKEGKIFYQKTILKEDAFCFAILRYKQADKAIYDTVSSTVFKSFK